MFNFGWKDSHHCIYLSLLCYEWGGFTGVYLPIGPIAMRMKTIDGEIA